MSEKILIFSKEPLKIIIKYTIKNRVFRMTLTTGPCHSMRVTVEGIKQTFSGMDTESLILAYDLMEPVVAKTSSEAPISVVKKILTSSKGIYH